MCDKNVIHGMQNNLYVCSRRKNSHTTFYEFGIAEKKGLRQASQKNPFKFAMYTKAKQIKFEFEDELFCNLGGMLQSQCAQATRPMAHMWDPTEFKILFLFYFFNGDYD